MIRNKSKRELIELVYKNDVINQNLTECLNTQHSMITDISDLYESHLIKTNRIQRFISFILIPFKVFNILNKHNKYFYTYQINKVNMNEKQVLEALDYINDYENKLSSPINYMNYIERVTGVNICKTCGNTNSRLHNDFQRRILNIIKKDFPYLLMKIELKSGKYGSEHYNSTVPTYTFHYLNNLLSKMAQDIKSFKNRGLHEASKGVEMDYITLAEYIVLRKQSSLMAKAPNTEVKQEVEVSTSVAKESPLTEDSKAVAHKEYIKPELIVNEGLNSSINEVIASVDTVIPDITKDSLNANVEPDTSIDVLLSRGVTMKNEGVHMKTISSTLGLPYKGLSARLKQYESSNK